MSHIFFLIHMVWDYDNGANGKRMLLPLPVNLLSLPFVKAVLRIVFKNLIEAQSNLDMIHHVPLSCYLPNDFSPNK